MDSEHPHDVDDNQEDLQTPTPTARKKRRQNLASKGTTRSWVWDHYKRIADNDARCNCNYCGREMACPTSSGTSNLQKHLSICKQYQVWMQIKAQTQQTLTPEGNEGTIKLSKVSEDVFREAVNEMILLGELPLSFTESVAWRHFCSRMNLYNPHSRRTATRDIVKMYVKRKQSMRDMFASNQQRVSLTTDIWVAPNTGASYMVITAHWIDANWLLRKLIIGFKSIADHKGVTIAQVLESCLTDWGITKVFTITLDNATANTKALKRFTQSFKAVGHDAFVLGGEFVHMRCAAHILNLVVRDGLQDMNSSIAAIRNGVTYVRSSTPRLQAFELRVASGKMSRGSIPLDCKTRWNSTYLMITKALKFRLAFDRMEAEDKLYNEYFEESFEGQKRIGPPTTADWDGIERLARFLVIFYNSTLVVSASNSINSYKCYAEIVTIERNLVKMSTDPDEELRKMACAMRGKFDKYWEGMKKINRLIVVASILDPRNKMRFALLCFERVYGKDNADAKEIHNDVYDVMKRLVEEYSLRNVNKACSIGTQSQSTATSSQSGQENVSVGEGLDSQGLDTDIGYERMDSVYKELIDEIGLDNAPDELENYLKEKVETPKLLPGTEFDVLSWWKHNETKYPILSEIAKDVLAMQVTSVASESAFSTSGRILDPYRSCLTHYMVEVLMCTEQWLKSDIHLRERASIYLNKQIMFDIDLQDQLERCNFILKRHLEFHK